MPDNETVDAINRLTSKLVVIEMILRMILVESLMEADRPIETMRDYAKRIEQSLTTAIAGEGGGVPEMMLQAEIAEQFGVLEKWLRQAGAQK